VFEVGSNHPGEIKYLCEVLGPTHAIVTNIGREHLEFFETVEGVAREEGDLFRYLERKSGGAAIVNADDHMVRAEARTVKRRVTYGFTVRGASVRGRKVLFDHAGCPSFEFRSPGMSRWRRIQLAVPGSHNADNALAAIAAGVAFRVPSRAIGEGLETFSAVGGRMERMMVEDVLVLNDSYNANPDSVVAALRTLAAIQRAGKRIAVLADMKELGAHAEESHIEVGRAVRELGIDILLTYGTLAKYIVTGAGLPGSIHYDQKNVLSEYLAELLVPGDTVLIKGSRAMKMEDVVIFLQERLRRRPAG
jgi:UDP-N-acetylmuramoyl-tripeptide--D-alanyl-D-alanine ligase